MTTRRVPAVARVGALLLVALVCVLALCSPAPQPVAAPQPFAAQVAARSSVVRVPVAHLSLHHAARPRLIAAYVKAVADEGHTLITTTETNRRMAVAVRKRMGGGWRVTRQGEYLIAWDRDDWRESKGKIVHLRRLTYVHSGRDAWRDMRQGSRRLVHRDTKTVTRVDVSHDPSAVQRGDLFRTDSVKQVRAWKQGNARQGIRAAGRPAGVVQVLHKDGNVDHHRWVWRARTYELTGLTSIWASTRPRGGTHAGGRLIDDARTTAPTSGARLTLTPPPRGVDHHGIRYVIHLTPRSTS